MDDGGGAEAAPGPDAASGGSAEQVVGIDREPVSAWLAANIDGVEPPFRFELIAGGHSNLTYRVTGAGGRPFVLRRPPLGAVLATAHDMGREHRIISAVGDTGVPVPTTLGLCGDEAVNGAPFYVMSFVDGVVLHDADITRVELPDHRSRRALSASVVEVLAELHLANVDRIGLGDLSRREGYLDRQLKRWKTQWESSKTRELPAMDRAFELLSEAKPEQRCTGVVHGDYRLGNLLVDVASASVAAVLDWELCTLGDVMADVGYLLNSWTQPGEETGRDVTLVPTTEGGFTTREELIDAYTAATGFEVTDASYYRAFQYWRLAAIAEGVYARYQKGVMGGDLDATSDYPARVEHMATEALALLQGRSG